MKPKLHVSMYLLGGISLMLVWMMGCAKDSSSAFPSKSITIVVPWDAGGGTDALARSIALQSGNHFHQVINVLDRSGGAGAIGHSLGATSRPDGYTVTMITFELCTYQPLGRLRLSPKDFKPVIQLNEDPAAITVHADSPWKTLREFLDYAREHPEKVTVGNSGPAAVWHIGALKLEKLAGVRFTHVPHNGAKPAVTQLLGKHLDAVAVSPSEVLQYLELNNLRCLGVMSEQRLSELPNVPTCREEGYDLVHGTWRGLAVPPETPDSIVAILEKGFKKGYDSTGFQESAHKALFGLRYRNAKQFADFLQEESQAVSELFSGTEITLHSAEDIHKVPRYYMAMFLVFALLLAVRTYRKSGKGLFSEMVKNFEGFSPAIQMACFSFLLLIGYGLLMFGIGYILATFLYLVAMFFLLGERRPKVIGIVSVSIVIVVYVIFKSVLDIPIPGLWG